MSGGSSSSNARISPLRNEKEKRIIRFLVKPQNANDFEPRSKFSLSNPHPVGVTKDVELMVYNNSKDVHKSIRMMKKFNNPNILSIEGENHYKIQDIEYHDIFVPPVLGTLKSLFVNHSVIFLNRRSSPVTAIVRYNFMPCDKIIKMWTRFMGGVKHLHDNNEFHGSLSLNHLYYVISAQEIIIKIANFKHNSTTLLEGQAYDFNCIGQMLDEIRHIFLNNPNFRAYDFRTVKDLADNLKLITSASAMITNLPKCLNRPFFLTMEGRGKYMTVTIPELLMDRTYKRAIESAKKFFFGQNGWKIKNFGVPLNKVETYNNVHYDEHSSIDLLKFLSAIFTHWREIKCQQIQSEDEVDNYVLFRVPDIYITLKNIEEDYGFREK